MHSGQKQDIIFNKTLSFAPKHRLFLAINAILIFACSYKQTSFHNQKQSSTADLKPNFINAASNNSPLVKSKSAFIREIKLA